MIWLLPPYGHILFHALTEAAIKSLDVCLPIILRLKSFRVKNQAKCYDLSKRVLDSRYIIFNFGWYNFSNFSVCWGRTNVIKTNVARTNAAGKCHFDNSRLSNFIPENYCTHTVLSKLAKKQLWYAWCWHKFAVVLLNLNGGGAWKFIFMLVKVVVEFRLWGVGILLKWWQKRKVQLWIKHYAYLFIHNSH